MSGMQLHSSVSLAWAIANRDACRGRSAAIEPAHFLLAILKLIDDAFQQDVEPLRLPANTLAELKELIAPARQLTRLTDVEITAARRGLRLVLQSNGAPWEPRVLHRSADARRLFAEALERAADTGADRLTMVHLLACLLENLPTLAEPFLHRGGGGGRQKIHCHLRAVEFPSFPSFPFF